MAERETWRNSTKGKHAVLKFDRWGNEVHEMVRPGQAVSLSPEERSLNMDRAADESLDVFKNGTFVPVRLLDGTEDAAEIASNPNLKSEGELEALFDLHWKKFEKEVSEITNANALVRLYELAEERDATVKQVKVIETAIKTVDPTYIFGDAADTIESFGEAREGVKPITPR